MGRRPTAQAEDDPDGILAISVTGGDFVWNLPPKEVDTEKATAKETKSNRQSSDPLKQSLLGAEDPTNSLVDDGSGILTRGDDPWAFRVEQVNIRVKKGSLVFVIGKIGCGKSSLLYALCGEMNRNSSHVQRGDPTPGELKVRGEIGLLSQSPWLISGTVLDNILLDKPLDPERLERALRCSQLELDIQEMAQGVHTFIGENGGSVSGGQRTRIALARLVYQDPDVLVLDDPLSALDLKVADRIMKEAICGELRDKTRIISTHAIHNLKYADYVYVMDQGRVVFEGTFSQMTESDIYNEFREVTQSFDLEGIAGNSEGEGETEEAGKPAETVGEQPAPEPAQEDSSAGELQTREMSQSTIEKADSMLRSNQTEAIDLEGVEEDKSKEGQTALVNKLFLEEDRVQGRLGFSTIQTCVRELGGIVPVILIMLSVFLMFGVMFLNDFYNLEWAKNFDPNNKFEYLKILLFLLYARPVIILIRGSFVFGSQLILSKNMHAKMMFRVLHAQIGEFLERVPAGRIINRFTKDIDVLDREIGYGLSTFYYSLGGVIVNIIVLVWTVGPILLLPLSVFLFVGAHYQRKVMNTKREVVRLQGVSRSPVISGLSGALKGLSEIRVLSKFGMVTQEFVRKLSDNAKNSFLISGLDSWYQIRINTINVCLIQIPGFAILGYYLYLTNEEYPIEKIILFVLRSMFISGDLTSLLLSIGSLESQLINLERCEGFSKIEPEARYLNFQMHEKKYLHPNSPAALKAIIRDLAKNEGAIISKGEVEFKDVYAKYPTKPNYVLQKLNLRVIAGQKIGIVGRTGAGKTSLIKLFWQCLEPCAGKVTFDGIDIMTADLKTLRSNMDIISQETAIFEGTLRENLDPKLEFLYPRDSPEFKAQDSKLLEKLYAIGFTDASLDYKGLDFPITAGGGNLSLGQRQLLSFMRILIAPKKLMILDEATANIDLKTEQLMQEAVKKEFKNSQQRVVK